MRWNSLFDNVLAIFLLVFALGASMSRLILLTNWETARNILQELVFALGSSGGLVEIFYNSLFGLVAVWGILIVKMIWGSYRQTLRTQYTNGEVKLLKGGAIISVFGVILFFVGNFIPVLFNVFFLFANVLVLISLILGVLLLMKRR